MRGVGMRGRERGGLGVRWLMCRSMFIDWVNFGDVGMGWVEIALALRHFVKPHGGGEIYAALMEKLERA